MSKQQVVVIRLDTALAGALPMCAVRQIQQEAVVTDTVLFQSANDSVKGGTVWQPLPDINHAINSLVRHDRV